MNTHPTIELLQGEVNSLEWRLADDTLPDDDRESIGEAIYQHRAAINLIILAGKMFDRELIAQ